MAVGLAHSASHPISSISESIRKTPAFIRIPNTTEHNPPLQTITKATSARFAPRASPVVMYLVSPSSVHDVALKPPQPWCLSVPAPKSKSAAAKQPQMPHVPCTEEASTGSSILIFLMSAEEPMKRQPPRSPMRTADPDSTLEQPAVIETKPAKIPLHSAAQSYFLVMAYVTRKTVTPPVAAESVVFIMTWAAIIAVPLSDIPKVEPGLKPHQPNQRMKVPITIRGCEWGWNSSSLSGSKRPVRLPTIIAPASAPMPPQRCTTPEPAKSM